MNLEKEHDKLIFGGYIQINILIGVFSMKSIKNIILMTGLLASGACFGSSWLDKAWNWATSGASAARSAFPKVNVKLGSETNNINHNGTVKHVNVQLPATQADIELAAYLAAQELKRAKEINEKTFIQRGFTRLEEQLYGLHNVSFLGINHFLTKSAAVALIYYYANQPVRNYFNQPIVQPIVQ